MTDPATYTLGMLDGFLAACALAAEPPRHQRPAREIGDASKRLIELAALPGGLTATAAIPALAALGLAANHSTACGRLDYLVKRGRLVRASAPGQRNHYFTTDAAASAWVAQFGPPVVECHAIALLPLRAEVSAA